MFSFQRRVGKAPILNLGELLPINADNIEREMNGLILNKTSSPVYMHEWNLASRFKRPHPVHLSTGTSECTVKLQSPTIPATVPQPPKALLTFRDLQDQLPMPQRVAVKNIIRCTSMLENRVGLSLKSAFFILYSLHYHIIGFCHHITIAIFLFHYRIYSWLPWKRGDLQQQHLPEAGQCAEDPWPHSNHHHSHECSRGSFGGHLWCHSVLRMLAQWNVG